MGQTPALLVTDGKWWLHIPLGRHMWLVLLTRSRLKEIWTLLLHVLWWKSMVNPFCFRSMRQSVTLHQNIPSSLNTRLEILESKWTLLPKAMEEIRIWWQMNSRFLVVSRIVWFILNARHLQTSNWRNSRQLCCCKGKYHGTQGHKNTVHQSMMISIRMLLLRQKQMLKLAWKTIKF